MQQPNIALMSEENILIYYQEYTKTVSATSTPGQESVEGFIQYAVDQGLINDTPAERTSIGIVTYRALFRIAADAGEALGFTTGAHFLRHSIQDAPSNLVYNASSAYAAQILSSEEMSTIRSRFIIAVSGKGYSTYTMTGSITLNSTTDLHLAYNAVSYTIIGNSLAGGKWNLTIIIRDRYDFEQQAWGNLSLSDALVTFINNQAASAQELGAIVPYDIQVTINTTALERVVEINRVDPPIQLLQ